MFAMGDDSSTDKKPDDMDDSSTDKKSDDKRDGGLRWRLSRPFGRMAKTIRGDSPPESPRGFAALLFEYALLFVSFYAVACVALGFSLGSGIGERFTIGFAAAIILTSAGSVGAVLGFIFGIPRALQAPNLQVDAKYTHYVVNTNLEQISDWLTKILVGVSLVQIANIRPALAALGRTLAPMLGSPTNTNGISTEARGAIGVGMSLTAALIAFLYCYLWTRVTLTWFLVVAEPGARVDAGERERRPPRRRASAPVAAAQPAIKEEPSPRPNTEASRA
jgi:hypothetical protein